MPFKRLIRVLPEKSYLFINKEDHYGSIPFHVHFSPPPAGLMIQIIGGLVTKKRLMYHVWNIGKINYV